MASDRETTPFTRLSRETSFRCPYYTIQHDRYRLPTGGEGDYFVMERPDSVFIIPQTSDGRFLLTRQFRYILQRDSVEFPGGGMDDGETPEQAAARELAEELGLQAARWREIASFAPYNGVTNELCHLFVAQELSPVSAERDQSEVIERLEWPAEAVATAIADNTIYDGMTVAAWTYYQLHEEQP